MIRPGAILAAAVLAGCAPRLTQAQERSVDAALAAGSARVAHMQERCRDSCCFDEALAPRGPAHLSTVRLRAALRQRIESARDNLTRALAIEWLGEQYNTSGLPPPLDEANRDVALLRHYASSTAPAWQKPVIFYGQQAVACYPIVPRQWKAVSLGDVARDALKKIVGVDDIQRWLQKDQSPGDTLGYWLMQLSRRRYAREAVARAVKHDPDMAVRAVVVATYGGTGNDPVIPLLRDAVGAGRILHLLRDHSDWPVPEAPFKAQKTWDTFAIFAFDHAEVLLGPGRASDIVALAHRFLDHASPRVAQHAIAAASRMSPADGPALLRAALTRHWTPGAAFVEQVARRLPDTPQLRDWFAQHALGAPVTKGLLEGGAHGRKVLATLLTASSPPLESRPSVLRQLGSSAIRAGESRSAFAICRDAWDATCGKSRPGECAAHKKRVATSSARCARAARRWLGVPPPAPRPAAAK